MSKEVVNQEYITNGSKRKATFMARKGSIMRKASELSILCGVEVGAIVFRGPSNAQPEVWPDHEGIQRVTERIQPRPVLEKTLTGEGTIQERINKANELLMRRRMENRMKEISQLMILCMAGKAMPRASDWLDLKKEVDQSLQSIKPSSSRPRV